MNQLNKENIQLLIKLYNSNLFDEVENKIQLGVVEKKNNILVGMVSAYNFNHISRTCFVSVITDLRKKNINRLLVFKECQDLLIDHLFFKLNLRKIYSGASDKKLSDMTRKIWGYKREGIFKKHSYIDGKYYDSYLLGLFKKDWETIVYNYSNSNQYYYWENTNDKE